MKKILEKEKIKRLLRENKGNKSSSARELGISRVTLYKKIKEYDIET